VIDYKPLYMALNKRHANAWTEQLPAQIASAFQFFRHGKSAEWQTLVNNLSISAAGCSDLNSDIVRIGCRQDLTDVAYQDLYNRLKTLIPWRKGPFELFGVKIDTEWRSDWKWRRLKSHIKPLKNRLVLDVGCGNGYFCWRMAGEQAKLVVGIDPLLLNVIQFNLIRKLYDGDAPVYVLPLVIEDLPPNLNVFDTVFSMGVLYHRRSPIDHLLELKACLSPGGELVLETLVIDGGLGQTLVPEDRYAGMRNVWFIPSCPTLISWLTRCGFNDIRLVDLSTTSLEEQRRTEWMPFLSLNDHLDSKNPSSTKEGHPAPKRAIFIAQKPRL